MEVRPAPGFHLGARYVWQAGKSFQLHFELAGRHLKFPLIEEDSGSGDDPSGFGVFYSLGMGWVL